MQPSKWLHSHRESGIVSKRERQVLASSRPRPVLAAAVSALQSWSRREIAYACGCVGPTYARGGCTGGRDARRLVGRGIEKAKSGLCQKPRFPRLLDVLNYEMSLWGCRFVKSGDFACCRPISDKRNIFWAVFQFWKLIRIPGIVSAMPPRLNGTGGQPEHPNDL